MFQVILIIRANLKFSRLYFQCKSLRFHLIGSFVKFDWKCQIRFWLGWVLHKLGCNYHFETAWQNLFSKHFNETLMSMFLEKWMSLMVNTVYIYWRGLSGRDGFLLQQKSSAAGFHLELWNIDMGDDLSVALAQYVSSNVSRCAVAWPPILLLRNSRNYLFSVLNILMN